MHITSLRLQMFLKQLTVATFFNGLRVLCHSDRHHWQSFRVTSKFIQITVCLFMFQAVNINATMKYSSSSPDICTYIYTHHSNAEFLSVNSRTLACLGCTSRRNNRRLLASLSLCVCVCVRARARAFLLKRNDCSFKLVIRYKVKCIVVPLHVLKALRESTGTSPLIINLSPARITPCK